MPHYIIFGDDAELRTNPNAKTSPIFAYIVEAASLDNAFKFAANKFGFASGNYRIDKLNSDDFHIRSVTATVVNTIGIVDA
jgi:hypothetical protein